MLRRSEEQTHARGRRGRTAITISFAVVSFLRLFRSSDYTRAAREVAGGFPPRFLSRGAQRRSYRAQQTVSLHPGVMCSPAPRHRLNEACRASCNVASCGGGGASSNCPGVFYTREDSTTFPRRRCSLAGMRPTATNDPFARRTCSSSPSKREELSLTSNYIFDEDQSA